ncbi:hypothetical protein ACS0TY_010098 [Phlomoides rotata]
MPSPPKPPTPPGMAAAQKRRAQPPAQPPSAKLPAPAAADLDPAAAPTPCSIRTTVDASPADAPPSHPSPSRYRRTTEIVLGEVLRIRRLGTSQQNYFKRTVSTHL